LRHLSQILVSSAFRSSHRSQEFLRYVVEHALHGEFERLKERILGIEIFHRNADYDTSEDAIVRVTASDVRKRLMQFYATADSEEFRIELPSGSYIPRFCLANSSVPAVLPNSSEPAVSETATQFPQDTSGLKTEFQSSETVVVADAELAQAVDRVNVAAEGTALQKTIPSQSAGKYWQYALLAALAAVLLFAAGWVAKGGSIHENLTLAESPAERAQYAFYKELLGPMVSDPQMETEIVLSNPKIFLYRGSNEPNPNEDAGAVKIPLSPSMAIQLAQGANDTQADFPFHRLVLDTNNYTGLGEAKAAFHLGALLEALGRPSHLSEARFLNWDVARSEHLIVLGSPHLSKWTQSSLTRANFTIEHDSIRNNRPLPGEQAVYVRTGDRTTLEDYGLIWMSQSPSGSRILVLAGITSAGTAGVGSFFADPGSMRSVYEQLKKASARGNFPSEWQVLLRINARENVPLKVSPIAVRVITNNN